MRVLRICILAFAAVLMLGSAGSAGNQVKRRFKVECKEGLVSVSAEKAPVADVLEEITRQTGFEVRGAKSLNEEVSANFSHLNLRDAMQILLGRVSYAIVEGRSSDGAMRPAYAIVFRQGTGADKPAENGAPSSEAPVARRVEPRPQSAQQVPDKPALIQPSDPESAVGSASPSRADSAEAVLPDPGEPPPGRVLDAHGSIDLSEVGVPREKGPVLNGNSSPIVLDPDEGQRK